MNRKIFCFGKKACVVLIMLFILTACESKKENADIQNETNRIEMQPSIEENTTEPTQSTEITAVEKAYDDILNADEFLRITNNGYTFKGYPISDDSVAIIGDKFVVNQGAMYEEIGAGIDLYCELGLSQMLDNSFFSVLLGTDGKPENWHELSREFYGFIAADGTEKNILSKLETLDTVKGSFDYEARRYSFEIADVKQTAEELKISQEMFGYVLAKLSEYTNNLVFEGNRLFCSFEVKDYSQVN